MLAFLLLMAATACLPSGMAWREWRAWYHLRRYGAEMPAAVRYHWVSPLGLFRYYFVIYEFEGETPDGMPFSHSRYTELDANAYQAFLKGEPLIVRYSVRNPAIFRLTLQPTEQWAWTWRAAAWGVVGFLLGVTL